MEGKYYMKKTPTGVDPKVYSEKAKDRVDIEMRCDVDNGYNQRISVLGMMNRLSKSEFKFIEDDRPGLVEEFKMLFPEYGLSADAIKALHTYYLENEKEIKLKKINWTWEEVTFVEE